MIVLMSLAAGPALNLCGALEPGDPRGLVVGRSTEKAGDDNGPMAK
jgi:hypothetical protein